MAKHEQQTNPALRVSDGMKGGTPAILYNMCLGLDKMYSEPIDDLDESIRKRVHVLSHGQGILLYGA